MQFLSKQAGGDSFRFNKVIFIPGWGFKGTIIDLMEPATEWLYPDSFIDPFSFEKELFAFLDKNKTLEPVLVGWSMGGYLALEFVNKYPRMIKSLHLLALRKKWPADEVDALRKKLLRDREATLKEFYRRCFLGHRPQYKAFVNRMQDEFLKEASPETLLRGLDYLKQIHIDALPELDTQFHHGKKDIVTSIGQSIDVGNRLLNVYPNAGHTVFFASGFDLADDKKKSILQKKFSAAAASYDEHALVQKAVIARLAEKLPTSATVRSVLEIGCGTGNYTAELVKKYPRQQITALDFSTGMITAAKQKHAGYKNVDFLCVDAEGYLERVSEKFDLITSNATLQWFDDLPQALARIRALLEAGGELLASVFGSMSMHQLHEALQELFGYEDLPVQVFPTYDTLKKSLTNYGKVEIEEIKINRQYDTFLNFLVNMKKTGTGGWHAVQPPVLTRSRMAKLDNWFADNYGGYIITYQVFLISAEK